MYFVFSARFSRHLYFYLPSNAFKVIYNFVLKTLTELPVGSSETVRLLDTCVTRQILSGNNFVLKKNQLEFVNKPQFEMKSLLLSSQLVDFEYLCE